MFWSALAAGQPYVEGFSEPFAPTALITRQIYCCLHQWKRIDENAFCGIRFLLNRYRREKFSSSVLVNCEKKNHALFLSGSGDFFYERFKSKLLGTDSR